MWATRQGPCVPANPEHGFVSWSSTTALRETRQAFTERGPQVNEHSAGNIWGRRQLVSGASLLSIAPLLADDAWAEDEPYDVVFDVDLGGDVPQIASFTVKVHPEWAPKGAAQFRKLVERGWYDGCGIFRVVPGFIAQFGLPAKPQPTLPNIEDDPVKVSNVKGTIVFATAGRNTRTSQLFINYKDNAFLDRQGFSPFAEVVGDGLQVAEQFYRGYGESPNQGQITAKGNQYLDQQFPKLAKIQKVTIKA